MIIKITFPFKNSINKIETKNIYIQTDDKKLINDLLETKNPIDIGIILSENENKFKITNPQKEDKKIIIEDIIANPNLKFF